MKLSRRRKQDAVIAMAIIVVLLALWRLGLRPGDFGGFGSWARAHVFGQVTLGALPGAGQNGAPVGSPVAPSQNAASSPPSLSTNSSALESTPKTNTASATPDVTLIADADSIDTPTPRRTNVVDAATMERRLGEEGAKGGDLQFSLFWRNINDLDLHCIDPANEEIFFQNKVSRRTGGELDVDQNAHQPFNDTPVENIFWPYGAAPPGLYRISVVFYAERDPGGTAFTVRTVVRGKTNFFTATIFFTGRRERNRICTLQYDPANPDPDKRYLFLRQ
jgi:hypothetical protein